MVERSLSSLDIGTIVPEATGLDCDFLLTDSFERLTNLGALFDVLPFHSQSEADLADGLNAPALVSIGAIGPELQGERFTGPPQKAFPCMEPECGKAFHRQSELRKHRKTHVDKTKRPHQCQKCSKRFLYGKDVRRHVLSKHRSADEHVQKHRCHYFACEKGFYRRDKLLRHMKKQHVEKGELQPRNPDVEENDLGLGLFDNTDCFMAENDDEGDTTTLGLAESMISTASSGDGLADSIYSNFSF